MGKRLKKRIEPVVRKKLTRSYVSKLPKNRETTKQVFLIYNWFNKSELRGIPFLENWSNQMKSLITIVEKEIMEVYCGYRLGKM